MTEERSTVRSRQLGDALRAAMRGAKLNGKATAELLGWSESRVSRLITGKLDASEVEVSALLALYGVVGVERDRLLQLTRDQNVPGWVREELDRTVIDHLRKSLRTVEFQVSMVPVLLQTEAYARAVISRMANAPIDGTEAFLTNRLSRQTVFSRTKLPQYTFYINEFALHLSVGSQRTMSDQLHHLLRMSVRSHISIYVIPSSVGAHAGLSGSCCLMEFKGFGPVVYVEGEMAGHFLEEPADVSAYQNVLTALSTLALDQNHSKATISRLAVDRYGCQESKASAGRR